MIKELLQQLFHTRSSTKAVHDIKNEIQGQVSLTEIKLERASQSVDKNRTITHNIAQALGVL